MTNQSSDIPNQSVKGMKANTFFSAAAFLVVVAGWIWAASARNTDMMYMKSAIEEYGKDVAGLKTDVAILKDRAHLFSGN